MRPLIQHERLICGFCSSGQCFAFGSFQTLPHGKRPVRSANSSPYRVYKGLSPSRACALPGARNKKRGLTPRLSAYYSTIAKLYPYKVCYVKKNVIEHTLKNVTTYSRFFRISIFSSSEFLLTLKPLNLSSKFIVFDVAINGTSYNMRRLHAFPSGNPFNSSVLLQ